MKHFTIFLLLAFCLGNAVAFAELTVEEYEQIRTIVTTANEALWERMKEYVDSKIEVLRKEIEVLRTEIREMDKRQTAQNSAQTERLTDHRNLLIVLITSVIGAMTVLVSITLFFTKKLLESLDTHRTELAAKTDEVRVLREENAALRAENERLKPQIVLGDKG